LSPRISSVAVVELNDDHVLVRLPDTPDGYAIGVKLSEVFAAKTGVAILHRRKRSL